LTLEVLNSLLVSLCRAPRTERSKVLALSGLGIPLTRIQTILTGLQFSNHLQSPDPISSSAGRSCARILSFLLSLCGLPSSLHGGVQPDRVSALPHELAWIMPWEKQRYGLPSSKPLW
jgi:hypothetical protein